MIEVPVAAEGVKTQPVALPALVKSAATKLLMDSEKVRLYAMLVRLVGVVCAEVKVETLGAVRSMVIVVVAEAFELGPVFWVGAPSATVLAFNRGVKVPSPQPVTVMVKLVPLL